MTPVFESPTIWEDEIRACEREDRACPPPRGGVVFAGSSSIRMWATLARDMAPLAVCNRGFGGACLNAVVHFAPRIVLPYEPHAVVLYGGENDLETHHRATPEAVLAEVVRFASCLHGALPSARLYLLSIKPSPARAAVWPAAQQFNRLIREFAGADPRRAWVDLATASLDRDGRPRSELFLDDGLHLSPQGYALWTSILRPLLLTEIARGAALHRAS